MWEKLRIPLFYSLLIFLLGLLIIPLIIQLVFAVGPETTTEAAFSLAIGLLALYSWINFLVGFIPEYKISNAIVPVAMTWLIYNWTNLIVWYETI